MGGFGGLFAGLSRGFGGRLLQRSDEEREEQRRFYERQENLLTQIATDPNIDPEAAETAWRTLGNLNSEYMKRSGIKGKDMPDYYGMMADMMKGRGGTTVTTTAGQNQPSMDTGVPNLFSTEGAHLPGAGQGGPMSPISTGQQPVSQQRTPNFAERQGIQEFRGIRRNPVYDQVVAAEAKAAFDAEQKAIDQNAARQRIYGEVNAGRMTPEAGARAIAAIDVGFPLPAERTQSEEYLPFTPPGGGPTEWIAKGEKPPTGYNPREKETPTSFDKEYESELAKVTKLNPQLSPEQAQIEAIGNLSKKYEYEKAMTALEEQTKKAYLARLGKSTSGTTKTGTITPQQARAHLNTIMGEANKIFTAQMNQAAGQDKNQVWDEAVAVATRAYQKLYGIRVADLQAVLRNAVESGEEDELQFEGDQVVFSK